MKKQMTDDRRQTAEKAATRYPLKWRLILETEGTDGQYNMAVDETLSLFFERGDSPPTLRIYRWNSPTLTLGFSQKNEQVINPDFCEKQGITVIKRVTGGKAVLHDRELTYSLVAARKGIFPDTITGTYHTVQAGLLQGIAAIGFEVETGPGNLSGADKRSEACFGSALRHEITIQGKKIAGGALRRFRNSFLLHGSILLNADAETLCQCIRFPSPEERERYKIFLKKKMAGLNDFNGRRITYQKLAQAIISGIESTLGIQLYRGELSEAEKREVERRCNY